MAATRLRKRAEGLAMHGLLSGLSLAGRVLKEADLEAQGIELLRDVPYVPGADAARTLDVYRPQGRGPFPTVLYIHGGGFRILSKDTHWMMGAMLARAGYLVFNVNYRLAPQHRFPAALEDVCDAYTFIAARGASFGADLGRLAIAGESAGANLATALTLALVQERDEPFARKAFATGLVPRAVVPYCGVFQVTDPGRFRRRKPQISRLVQDRIHIISEGYAPKGHDLGAPGGLLDPVVELERGPSLARPLPPFLIPVGTKDPLIDDSRRLERALVALGGDARLRYYPDEIHAFHAFVWRAQARACWDDTYAFLEETLSAA
ncbi:MAG: alpha/beta hydrolase [Polyangiales bacterium]|nr:alpha/beta hydrolase [Sandaracinaceae bacterium]